MPTIDPCDQYAPIEEFVKAMDKVKMDARSIYPKTGDKTVHPVACFMHMLETGKIMTTSALPIDEHGNPSIIGVDPKTLTMSSKDWETRLGLLPMGEYCEQVSMYGADLTDSKQAENSKQAFVDYPQEIFSLAISEIYKLFQAAFTMERFTIESSEQNNPLNQMMLMQEVMCVIQNRCVRAHDEMGKIILTNLRQRG